MEDGILAGAAAIGWGRMVLASGYALLSLVAFSLYGLDKAAARRGGRRTPEYALHVVALAGGWPGALAGQVAFRHKTRKQPFRGIFWATVAVNCAALTWLLAASPAWLG